MLFLPVVLLLALTRHRARLLRLRQRACDDEFICGGSDWEYAAEGALNIALRYVGKNPKLRGHVLRLRKGKPGMTKFNSTYSLQTTVRFIETIMVNLLGREYVPKNQLVHVSETFLREVDEQIMQHRPSHRRVHALDFDSHVGVLMKDHARMECTCGECASYCVEIKPKWGMLFPESKWEVKRRIDRFTLHQQLKLATRVATTTTTTTPPDGGETEFTPMMLRKTTPENGLIGGVVAQSSSNTNNVSAYDPMQLFHGQVREALRKLVLTPQNNLRLFRNGKLIYPTSDHGTALDADHNSATVFHVLGNVLENEDVLHRILHAQVIPPQHSTPQEMQKFEEMLSRGEAPCFADIEYVYPLYESMLQSGETVVLDLASETTHPSGTDSPTSDVVRNFLISCTARDCSIMVAMSTCTRLCVPPKGSVQHDGKTWFYDVAVVDLDPKPVEKMKTYFDTDFEIASLYTRLEKSGTLLLPVLLHE